MKNAPLWKRILNEGIVSLGTTREKTDEAIKQIIQAPIIVDTRELPQAEEFNHMDEYSSLVFPFPKFWLEGTKLLGTPFGSLVKSTPDGNGFKINVLCIIGIQQNPMEVIGGLAFEVDAHGNPRNIEQHVSPAMGQRNNLQKMAKVLYGCGGSICDTLQMLGCKNISLEPHENDPKQVRRAINRHGGTSESYRYHTLVVRPPGAKSDSPSQEIGMMPRHVCRGHFSEYGPEFNKGLLFGKYSGRFYVPPHLKGDKKNGIVEKDYAIA